MKYISQFYDINKKTQTEQVLQNMSDIADLKNADDTLQENIDKEVQDRTDADASLAYDIDELQHQIDGLGNVFTLKGSVATYSDLPASDNNIGDVWYVVDEAVGYVWIDDNGTERWEQLGLPIDLSDYVTTSDLALALDDYQEKLIAGTNISIIDNVISATSGSNNAVLLDTSTQAFQGSKTLTTPSDSTMIKLQSVNNPNRYFTLTPYYLGMNYDGNHYVQVRALDTKNDIISKSGGTYATIDLPTSSGTFALTSDCQKKFNCSIIDLLKPATLTTDLNAIYTCLNATSDSHINGIEINTGLFDSTYDEIHVDLSVLSQYGVNLYDGELVFHKVMSSTSITNPPMWTCYFTIQAFTGSTVINENRINLWSNDSGSIAFLSVVHKYLT